MSNKGIDLVTKYYQLLSRKHSLQIQLDRVQDEVNELKNGIDEIDSILNKLKNKAPELFEQLEKEYE